MQASVLVVNLLVLFLGLLVTGELQLALPVMQWSFCITRLLDINIHVFCLFTAIDNYHHRLIDIITKVSWTINNNSLDRPKIVSGTFWILHHGHQHIANMRICHQQNNHHCRLQHYLKCCFNNNFIIMTTFLTGIIFSAPSLHSHIKSGWVTKD